jgi:hypothetical protein
VELYDRTVHIWTSLEEDERIQQLDQRQEKVTTKVHDLKQRQKAMAILERMKSAQEMKNLQEELKTSTRRKTSKAGSIGAIAARGRKNDRRTTNRERKTITGTCRKQGSVERAHDGAGCGDTGRKECAGKGESDRFGKEVSCTRGSAATSELSLSGLG